MGAQGLDRRGQDGEVFGDDRNVIQRCTNGFEKRATRAFDPRALDCSRLSRRNLGISFLKALFFLKGLFFQPIAWVAGVRFIRLRPLKGYLGGARLA